MNQILNFENNEKENNINNLDAGNRNITKSKNKLNAFLKIQFIFSNIITIFFVSYFIHYKTSINKEEKLSQKLLSDLDISNLYSSSTNYTSEKIYYNYDNNCSFYIIGIIEIPKINITYPIISQLNDEFLKIAPCKFYGPELNEVR